MIYQCGIKHLQVVSVVAPKFTCFQLLLFIEEGTCIESHEYSEHMLCLMSWTMKDQ